MKTNRFLPDPLGIRKTAAFVLENSEFVFIDYKKLKIFAEEIKERIDRKELLGEWQFGKVKKSPQDIFILDTVNFCFWAKKNEEKWKVEYPKGNISDGWKALVACFDRAMEEKIPISDCGFLEHITLAQVKKLFRSCNGTEIPLLEKRFGFLRQSARILRRKFGGDFNNLLKQSKYDAIQIAKIIIKYFPSFRDSSSFLGKKIKFYKRAQICAYDFSLLNNSKIKNIDQLTAFADYKLPQILRDFGVLVYRQKLAEKIDNYILLKKDSREEIEIRSATIYICDLIAKEIGVSAVVAENAIWSLSQIHKAQKPYHRILTTNY